MSKWKASFSSVFVVIGCIAAMAYSIHQYIHAYYLLRELMKFSSSSHWNTLTVMFSAMQLFILLAGCYVIKESVKTLWGVWK